MEKDGSVVIANFQKGQASSPYLGFASIRNWDVFTTPGVARIANRLENTSIVSTKLPVAYCKDEYGNEWVLAGVPGTSSNSSVLYKNGSSYTDLAGTPWDMVIYKNFLIIRHGSYMSTIATDGSTAFFPAWKLGLTQTCYGKLLVSKSDGFLYIANGNDVKKITDFAASGSFSVAPTGTVTTAIQLPSGYYATTIEEMLSLIYVGTQTNNSWATRYSSQEATIFPYRIGASSTQYEDPITVSDANCIQQLKASNNMLYFTAGMKGNVYYTNGSSYKKLTRIPFFQYDETSLGIQFYPNAITIVNSGNLLIGTSSYFSGYYGTAAYLGVYEVNLFDPKYPAVLKNTISTGTFQTSSVFNIGFIAQPNVDTILVGWQDGSSYGLDRSTTFKYTNYTAVIETQLYYVGGGLNPWTNEYVNIQLGKPLITGQGIKIYVRNAINATYTLLGSWDYATWGSTTVIRDRIQADALYLAQFKIEATTPVTSGTTTLDNIELVSIRLD